MHDPAYRAQHAFGFLHHRAHRGLIGHVYLYRHHFGTRRFQRAHRIDPGTRQRITTPDHLPPKAQLFFARDRQWLNAQALHIGPYCQQVIDWLLGDRVLERLRAAQGVIGLAKTYGVERLELACRRAMAHNSPYYRTVKTILSSNSDRLPMPEHNVTTTYAKARFARDAASLFAPDPHNPQQDLLH